MPECIFIDSADQATITEADKYLFLHPKVYGIAGSWKKMKIVDRLHLQLGWFSTCDYLDFGTLQKPYSRAKCIQLARR